MKYIRYKVIVPLVVLLISVLSAGAQPLWHDTSMSLHYRPAGNDFVKVIGTKKFNRALYGGNTAFRVEAGDLPEFAMYMPGMGGNFRLALLRDGRERWLTAADDIQTVYRPGSMIYTIKDPILGNGSIVLTVLALYESEGMILKASCNNIPAGTNLLAVYGGASGKKFSRNGDIGADPESSFYLLPEYCKGNRYEYRQNIFTLHYAYNQSKQTETATISGVFPKEMKLRISNALQTTPIGLDTAATAIDYPVLTGRMKLPGNSDLYFLLQNPASVNKPVAGSLPVVFSAADATRRQLAERVQVQTPDSFINTLGGALAIAADAIWEDPSYLHGAVAWRMRLNAWRGAYVADPLSWHDRAIRHFDSYALSQVTSPAAGPVVPDTARNFARQLEQMGTALFSSGYISRNPGGDQRPHHYDMNLVFIDQLLNHFNWSGDTGYVRKLWPLLKRHLAWEKRNFDTDGDGLYDAYACIWASDALQYSGGGVMHASAYNYRANRSAAALARLLGEEAGSYEQEADKISKAIHTKLWSSTSGLYAEYKDMLGNQLLHLQPGAWTVYHTLDAQLADPFKAWQMLQYAAHELPRIPVVAKGLQQKDLYLTSTTNWQPYTWSVNNVALAENLHLSLAYWQGGNKSEAFRLWKSAIIESMYLSSSPGGFEQLSFYDAVRGELYRDFADPIGMAGRSLVEGLFGILPDALNDTLLIRPGFPAAWGHAAIKTPDIIFDYKEDNRISNYHIVPSFRKPLYLKLEIAARASAIDVVLVNGKPASWQILAQVGGPLLQIQAGKQDRYDITVKWKGASLEQIETQDTIAGNDPFTFRTRQATILSFNDPQEVLQQVSIKDNVLQGQVKGAAGNRTLFVKLQQDTMSWWQPLALNVCAAMDFQSDNANSPQSLKIISHSNKEQRGQFIINPGKGQFAQTVTIPPHGTINLNTTGQQWVFGNNTIRFHSADGSATDQAVYSSLHGKGEATILNLNALYNDKVTHIFRHRYFSPRPASPTLQLPLQGIGNWCYPLVQPVITDTGLRSKAGAANQLSINGIPFNTPSDTTRNNILFVSQWDLFKPQATISLKGKGSHLYVLMTGTTNHMQSQMINGTVTVDYADGTQAILELKNPETWWPIEQDYYEDGYAFQLKKPVPPRIHLKDGSVHYGIDERQTYTTLKGFSNRMIEGGAATLLDLPLDNRKPLKSMTITAIANDVIIGLMSATIIR